ncbi:MAG: hypothetical protein HONBIEJF_02131 [Fimbriimonadaceae bacterium]|nr:hypothetical protein [Fimbriimonadaceae bacterium]
MAAMIKGILIAALALGSSMQQPAEPDAKATVTAAKAFLGALTADQRRKAIFAFTSDLRSRWQYVPAVRQGAHLSDLDVKQVSLAAGLLKAAIGESGYHKVEDIRILEAVLFELEGQNASRDDKAYVFAFWGEPSLEGDWGWRYEGHHVSLNFTYRDGKLTSSTPQFLGSNPATVGSGEHKGKRVLGKEQDLGFAFVNSLSAEQRRQAVVSERAPSEILTGMDRKAAIQDRTGIPYDKLDSNQQKALMSLVSIHAEVQHPNERARRLGKIDKKSIVFAWMGSLAPGDGHYYRIQGSTFLIEYDNTQNRANHIHTVWRDFDGDFGNDALADHYAHSHH